MQRKMSCRLGHVLGMSNISFLQSERSSSIFPKHTSMKRHIPLFCRSMVVSPTQLLLNNKDMPFSNSNPKLRAHIHNIDHFAAGGFSEKQQRVTELSDPSLSIAGQPFLTTYAQGVNNTDWKMTHIWKGAPYENTTVDDVGFLRPARSLPHDLRAFILISTVPRLRMYST